MSLISLFGALEVGLIFGLVALGVLISFRILNFPDLTADGSFPLGGAVCAVCIVSGMNPWLATLLGTLAGAAARLCNRLAKCLFKNYATTCKYLGDDCTVFREPQNNGCTECPHYLGSNHFHTIHC